MSDTIKKFTEKKFGGNATEHKIAAFVTVCKERFGLDGRAFCFAGVLATDSTLSLGQIGVAEYGIGGYSPLFLYADNLDRAMALAEDMNARLGLSPIDAAKIVCDTMRRPAGMKSA